MNARISPEVAMPREADGDDTADWSSRNQRWLVRHFAALRKRIENGASNAPTPAGDDDDDDAFAPALDRLSQRFGLSPFERELLLLAAGVELDAALRRAVAQATGNGRPTFALALALFDGAHWDALAPDAPLRHWRLVEIDRAAPLADAALRIDERVLHFISGVAATDERLAGIARLLRGGDAAPDASDGALVASIARALFDASEGVNEPGVPERTAKTCPIKAQSAAVARATASICNAGAIVRFGGTSGHVGFVHTFSGHAGAALLVAGSPAARAAALDIARAAAATAGSTALLIDAHDLPTEPRERAELLRALDRDAALGGAVLVVRLDASAGTQHADTSLPALGSFLAQLRSPLVLIGASAPAELIAPLQAERRVVRFAVAAPQAAVPAGVPWAGAVRRATQQFRVSAQALRQTLDGMAASNEPITDDALWAALRESARGGLDELAERIESRTSIADLVLPRAQLAQLADVTRQLRHRSLVFDDWGFAAKSQRGLGLAALFAGESGTGKTMAAEAIANEARLDLYRIDLASVVSKYIGETEKNLKRLFDAAEASGAVLLFDEADALFGKRSEVKDSHDRYANIEVAYLLQRVETYRGLAILTSNMKSALDRAFLRRIRFVVQFPFPDEAARAELWRRQFPPAAPVGAIDTAALAKLSLAGGNIRSIAVNAAFIAADRGCAIEHGMVIDAARAEFAKLERVFIGAA